MFKVKEGLSIGGKTVTGSGATEVLTAADVGSMAYQNSDTFSVTALTATNLRLDDTDSGYFLNIQSTSTLSSDKQLTFDINDTSRIISLVGDSTLSGTNSGDQSISFGSTGLTPSTATYGNLIVAGTLVSGNGGTGLNSVTNIGELYYGNNTTTMGRIAPVIAGSYLASNGTSAPAVWIPFPAINTGTLTLSINTAAGATNTTVTIGTGTGYNANAYTNSTYDIKVGPALTALTTMMTGSTSGFIKKSSADVYTLDTTSYYVTGQALGTPLSGTLTNCSIPWSGVSNKPSPTITLIGDVTGSGTLTSLADGTITTTIADDSHNHSNYVTFTNNETITGAKSFSSELALFNSTISGNSPDFSFSVKDASSNLQYIRISQTSAFQLNFDKSTNAGAKTTLAKLDTNGNFTAIGGGTFDVITVGLATTNEITTTAGSLILNSFIGTTIVDDNLSVYGNITVPTGNISVTIGDVSAVNFNSTSDGLLKTNIQPFDGLALLNRINPVSFDWKSNSVRSYGVIAQELEKEFPELVQTNSDGMKTVSYIPMIAMLMDTVKKLNQRVKFLEDK